MIAQFTPDLVSLGTSSFCRILPSENNVFSLAFSYVCLDVPEAQILCTTPGFEASLSAYVACVRA